MKSTCGCFAAAAAAVDESIASAASATGDASTGARHGIFGTGMQLWWPKDRVI
jgi:hypothetical protein